MKRADTYAVNFTSISWGEDILDLVGYEPVVYFSDIIEEAEKGAQNISPSQAASLENQGKLSGEGKSMLGASKGSGVSKGNRAIVVEAGNVAGLQQEVAPGNICDVFVTAGPVGEPTTIRVPASRTFPRRR